MFVTDYITTVYKKDRKLSLLLSELYWPPAKPCLTCVGWWFCYFRGLWQFWESQWQRKCCLASARYAHPVGLEEEETCLPGGLALRSWILCSAPYLTLFSCLKSLCPVSSHPAPVSSLLFSSSTSIINLQSSCYGATGSTACSTGYGFNFIWGVYWYLFQHHSLKRFLSTPNFFCNFVENWSKISHLYMNSSIFVFSILFHWSICVPVQPFFQYPHYSV